MKQEARYHRLAVEIANQIAEENIRSMIRFALVPRLHPLFRYRPKQLVRFAGFGGIECDRSKSRQWFLRGIH